MTTLQPDARWGTSAIQQRKHYERLCPGCLVVFALGVSWYATLKSTIIEPLFLTFNNNLYINWATNTVFYTFGKNIGMDLSPFESVFILLSVFHLSFSAVDNGLYKDLGQMLSVALVHGGVRPSFIFQSACIAVSPAVPLHKSAWRRWMTLKSEISCKR